MDTRRLTVTPTTRENLAAYGRLIDVGGAEAAFASNEFSFWNELAVIDEEAPLAVGVVESYPRPLTCSAFERHVNTTETLVPMNGDILLVLGVPTEDEYPDPGTVRAFRIPQGTGITLHRGTWHYAPLTAGKPVKSLVVFRKGTPDNDLLLQNLEKDKGVSFEVAL